MKSTASASERLPTAACWTATSHHYSPPLPPPPLRRRRRHHRRHWPIAATWSWTRRSRDWSHGSSSISTDSRSLCAVNRWARAPRLRLLPRLSWLWSRPLVLLRPLPTLRRRCLLRFRRRRPFPLLPPPIPSPLQLTSNSAPILVIFPLFFFFFLFFF